MALDRIVNIVLRAAELVFAAIVAGVTGEHLHNFRHASSWSQGRFIYTEVVAALSIFFSLLWLVPFSWSFVHWPVDIILSLCWWAAFGLLVNVSDNSMIIFSSPVFLLHSLFLPWLVCRIERLTMYV
jgi:hypothetical protein